MLSEEFTLRGRGSHHAISASVQGSRGGGGGVFVDWSGSARVCVLHVPTVGWHQDQDAACL